MSNAALLATALRLIDVNGAPVTFRRVVEGAHDSVTGAAAQGTLLFSAKAVFDNMTPFEKSLQQTQELLSKRLWVAGAALTTAPEPGDTVEFDGSTWSVIACDKINPDGTTYLYSVHVQR